MSLETKYLNTSQYLFSYLTGVAKCYNIRKKCKRNPKRTDDKINATQKCKNNNGRCLKIQIKCSGMEECRQKQSA